MAAISTVRILAALSVLTSLGVMDRVTAAPAARDSATTIDVAGNRTEVQTEFEASPPKGFSSVSYRPSSWLRADASPCAQAEWTLPPGATGWLWSPNSCAFPWSNLVLRRTFVVPAQTVLTARMWFAIHGSGHASINGRVVGQSAALPTMVDVTKLLRANGATNVIAFDATAGIDGAGIAYDLRLVVSTGQFHGYRRAHPTYSIPTVPAVLVPATPTPEGTTAVSGTAPQGGGACLNSPSLDVGSVFTNQTSQTRLSTGWVYGSQQDYLPNQTYPYVVTRLVNLSGITQPAQMPSVAIDNQVFPAVAIASDVPSGDQVLVLPPSAASFVQALDLTISATHNQPVGDAVKVTADSSSRGCLAQYQPHVFGYTKQISSQPIAQLDTLPYNDAADGAVAQDSQNRFLGTVEFLPDVHGGQQPYIVPYSVMQPDLDALIKTLAGGKAAPTQQMVVEANFATGDLTLSYTNVTPVGGAGGGQPSTSTTPSAGSTPGAVPTPGANQTPGASPTAGS